MKVIQHCRKLQVWAQKASRNNQNQLLLDFGLQTLHLKIWDPYERSCYFWYCDSLEVVCEKFPTTLFMKVCLCPPIGTFTLNVLLKCTSIAQRCDNETLLIVLDNFISRKDIRMLNGEQSFFLTCQQVPCNLVVNFAHVHNLDGYRFTGKIINA